MVIASGTYGVKGSVTISPLMDRSKDSLGSPKMPMYTVKGRVCPYGTGETIERSSSSKLTAPDKSKVTGVSVFGS